MSKNNHKKSTNNKKNHNDKSIEIQTKENNQNDNKLLALEQKIVELETLNNNLINQNNQYKLEIEKINQDYISKVNQKATEAQNLVKQKIVELENKSKQEIDFKINKFIEDKFNSLLTTIDQFEKVINSTNPSATSEVLNYLTGFRMFLDMFQNSLNNLDIHQISIKIGDKFDESYMQASELVEDTDVGSNCVSAIISNAYKYKDKIIKFAIVKVQK